MLRRDFLTRAALVSTAATLRGQPPEGWAAVPAILARIRPPAFPNRDFDVRRYGASGDGKTDCRPAIAKAVAETGANSIKQMGAVVKAAKAHLEGKVVDGKALSDRVRARLS